jgi:hypothetical protein
VSKPPRPRPTAPTPTAAHALWHYTTTLRHLSLCSRFCPIDTPRACDSTTPFSTSGATASRDETSRRADVQVQSIASQRFSNNNNNNNNPESTTSRQGRTQISIILEGNHPIKHGRLRLSSQPETPPYHKGSQRTTTNCHQPTGRVRDTPSSPPPSFPPRDSITVPHLT